MPYEVRNFFMQRLTRSELQLLANRVGDIRLLVAPTRLSEVDGFDRRQIIEYLQEDPRHLRRPIIDTGEELHLGFTAAVRKSLTDA
jgi:arsenate reductase-like glutaredoxin family protein